MTTHHVPKFLGWRKNTWERTKISVLKNMILQLMENPKTTPLALTAELFWGKRLSKGRMEGSVLININKLNMFDCSGVSHYVNIHLPHSDKATTTDAISFFFFFWDTRQTPTSTTVIPLGPSINLAGDINVCGPCLPLLSKTCDAAARSASVRCQGDWVM